MMKRNRQNQINYKEEESYMSSNRNRDLRTEKTIEELKKSLSSIQDMIQKSQNILRKTKPLQPRQARSDSLQLSLQLPSREKSRQRSNKKEAIISNQLSAATISRNQNNNNEKSFRTEIGEKKKSKEKIKIPQKTKPQRLNLYINTDDLNSSKQSIPEVNLFSNLNSPISVIPSRQDRLNESLNNSLESPINNGGRLITDINNMSYDISFRTEESIDKKIGSGRKEGVKKVILRRNKGPRNEESSFKTYQQLQQHYQDKEKKKKILKKELNGQLIAKGKYSYANQSSKIKNGYGSIKSIAKQTIKIQDSQLGQTKTNHQRPKQQNCQKFNKQNKYQELKQFHEKIKKFGFVQRYLDFNQIAFIHQFLKVSGIPQHKWPLYVVDKVYEKMQNLNSLHH